MARMVEVALRGGAVPQLAKYEVREEIGHGGMATVYRAVDRRLGREVAVKVIHPHLRASPEVAARFHTEAQAVAKLRHPNIVEIFDVAGREEPEQYLVVELVRGTTLRRLLSDHGAMPPEIAGAIAVALLEALGHAHGHGVIHRDLKPENVLIQRHAPAAADGGIANAAPIAIKLTDFGIAKLLDAQGVTSTGQVLGSPAHMAPEQIEGGEVDGRSDVFGLGVLLYECMVGHLPFQGNNPAQVLRRVLDGAYSPACVERPSLGDRWSGIVDRALAHHREARFADAAAMREAVVYELERLGFWPVDREVEAFLDDPEAYAPAYVPRIVERLCERADGARKRGDALAAASDYNRALANAPDDPRLLQIVNGMHRRARARRVIRGSAAILSSAACLVALVGGAARFARLHPSARAPESGATGRSFEHAVSPADGPLAAIVPPPAAVAPAPDGSSSSAHLALAVARPVERRLTLDLIPPMGISVAIDQKAARFVSTGDALVVDSRAHTLVFSCAVCSTIQLPVAPGEHDDTLVVSVPVKPATLIIEGEVDRTYQIAQHPEIAVRAGASTIPLKSAFEHVVVKQIETGATVSVRLEAGKSVRARF